MDLFGATVSSTAAFFLFGELVIFVALVLAFVLARMHRGSAHHYIVLISFLADVLVFKPLMFLRANSAWGSFPWDGTKIAPHLIISAVVAVFGVAAVVLGFKHRVRKGSKMFLPPKGRLHKLAGWIFLSLWFATFALGLVIFIEAYFP